MPVDTTSPPPCPVSPVKISPSAMSPPPLRRKFPCPTAPRADVLLGYPHELLSQVAIPEVLLVCNVRKGAFEDETLGDWAIEISMAFLRKARQSRLKLCQIAPFPSPHSIFDRLPLQDA
jgi:hypothetical protein